MRLLIISHTEHYRSGSTIVGWGATIREIDHLASLFDEVVHIAPLHLVSAPASGLPYQAANVRFRAVPPAGGEQFIHKLGILWRFPDYVRAMINEMRAADVVHVRFPAAISLIAFLLLALRKHPTRRWFKYAGSWSPRTRDALSYRIQRWLLSQRWHRGVVTVTGSDLPLPANTQVLANPCLTDEELAEGAAITKSLDSPVRLLYVGRVEEAKGIGRAVEVIRCLHQRGIPIRLDVIGDGLQRPHNERAAADLEGIVHFHGEKPRHAINEFYARAHFLLLSSASEGWPKVISEGMAYGVVPIVSDVGSIRTALSELKVGAVIPVSDIEAYANAIQQWCLQPADWQQQSDQAKQSAHRFTYRAYIENIRNLLRIG